MSEQSTALTLDVTGMDCANCALTLEKGVARLDGVQQVDVIFGTGKMRVVGDVSQEEVVARVRALGHDVAEPGTEAQAAGTVASSIGFLRFMWQQRETQLALLGALLILPGLLIEELMGVQHWLVDLSSIVALIAAGWPIARSAWQAIRINREVNINVLMTVASIGAAIIGAYTEAGMVMVLFAVGEALEGYTADKARNALRGLMDVVPNEATRLRRDSGHVHEEPVPVKALQVGDVILVRPGERIPMDGRVIAGSSAVNQAPITGESRLIEKTAGLDVFASSINGEGSLEIEVTHLAADNTISRLIKMVEEAQEKRAPTQRFVDRFARVYTPIVVVLAALTAIVPPLFLGQPFLNPDAETFGWLYRGLALLVVACPCALVISTPVSIISAISNAARHGVLIKGGTHLEALSRVKAIAFDKTGTLTAGRPSVVAVRSVEDLEAAGSCEVENHAGAACDRCDELVALAAAVEQRSEHPLAQAIIEEAVRRGVHGLYPAAEEVTALVGRGVTGRVDGRQVTIGSHRHFAEVPHAQEHCEAAKEDAGRSNTPVMVGVDDHYVGTIALADTVRPTSREAVAALRELGVASLTLLSGDNQQTAQSVAEQVGITEVMAELLPEQKVSAVEALRKAHGGVAMVGDGINDAPALATADVGIAAGAALGGTAQAMETADIALMGDDMRRLPFAFRLSYATMRTVMVNVALSLGIKAAFLGLVLAGVGTMWMAVLADVGVSLLVTVNGMRLLRRPTAND